MFVMLFHLINEYNVTCTCTSINFFAEVTMACAQWILNQLHGALFNFCMFQCKNCNKNKKKGILQRKFDTEFILV